MQNLFNQLLEYQQRYPDEVAPSQVLEFMRQHPDCFVRSCLAGHITGSCWLLNPEQSKVLLTHHRKLNLWCQLGGHADGEQNILAVALREAYEESGLENITALSHAIFDVDVHFIPARPNEPEHYHYDIRYLLQASNEEYVVSNESISLAWFAPEETRQVAPEESIQRMVRKWQAFQAICV